MCAGVRIFNPSFYLIFSIEYFSRASYLTLFMHLIINERKKLKADFSYPICFESQRNMHTSKSASK